MSTSNSYFQLSLAGALLLLGGIVAACESSESNSPDDPCFGQGNLVRTVVPVPTIGPDEYLHVCEPVVGRLVWLTADGDFVNETFNLETATAYYEEHPEEHPLATINAGNQLAFIEPTAHPNQTAGCDAEWIRHALPNAGDILCAPADWVEESIGANLLAYGNGRVAVWLNAPSYDAGTFDARFDCEAPRVLIINTVSGQARLCSGAPYEFGQNLGLILTDGRKVGINYSPEATDADKALALRVAAAVEATPPAITPIPSD